MVISVANYAYLVPYVENEEELFLKTIILSRKATKLYLGEKYEDSTHERREGNTG
jgi:hypothetical protein